MRVAEALSSSSPGGRGRQAERPVLGSQRGDTEIQLATGHAVGGDQERAATDAPETGLPSESTTLPATESPGWSTNWFWTGRRGSATTIDQAAARRSDWATTIRRPGSTLWN